MALTPSIPTFFVVSLARAAERRERMLARFLRQDLAFVVVDAVDAADRSCPEIDRYQPNPTGTAQDRAVTACFASHIKALHRGLDSGAAEFIVVEDDVRLAVDFPARFAALWQNIPAEAPLTSLSYLVWHWDGFLWSGVDHTRENLTTMGPDLWGTQMYLVTRRWAERCVELFDRPLPEIATSDIRTSELVVRSARSTGGLVAYPPLGIEELSGSLLVPEAGNANHGSGLRWWNEAEYDS